MAPPTRQGLYDPRNEHDSCGMGFVAHVKGERSNAIIRLGLKILANLDHRGGVGGETAKGGGARSKKKHKKTKKKEKEGKRTQRKEQNGEKKKRK